MKYLLSFKKLEISYYYRAEHVLGWQIWNFGVKTFTETYSWKTLQKLYSGIENFWKLRNKKIDLLILNLETFEYEKEQSVCNQICSGKFIYEY